MDIIKFLLEVPVNTLLILSGIAIVFFAFFEVNKGSVKLRRALSNSNFVPAGMGIVLILAGLFYKTGAATPIGLPEISIGFTEVAPVVPSATTAPADAPAAEETDSPTEAPVIPSETASPVPVKTLADGCIAAQTWQAKSSDVEAFNSIAEQDNCLDLSSLGFAAETGEKLNLVVPRSNAQTTSGIFTSVDNQSVIEFKVRVNSFHIADQAKPAYIGFAIAPQNNPMAVKGSGRFKLQIENTGNAARLYFLLADADESTGIKVDTQNYQYKRTADIRMELNGPVMNVYINNLKQLEAIRIPSGPIVFYIGYDLPLLAGADIQITDIVVDGVNQ
jgi:hypothetical protein